ncbi:hypothetical protein MSAN_00931300 [Mycena sanguinolenta]|uniref:Zn(2)-C6 fungal-type domain-containing protein n=1 Tax=Mycena sanguinolenta TaxID=230812 RepID=A0A8H7DBI5_9AGAR|nr:hypothetical protein MSAN_00931300 [Mycena sanguinolenta]
MKRAAGPSSENPTPKRTKTGQACAACRKQKSRCEILDGPAPGEKIRCHRCKVLNITDCSFENPHLIPLPPPTSHVSSTPQTQSTAPPASSGPASDPDNHCSGLSTLAAVASSRSSVEGVSAGQSLSIRPESLPMVPAATTPVWGSVSRVDWTATPVLAFQELVRCPRCEAGVQIPSVERLPDILSPSEISSLLEIFEAKYTPWICGQPGPLEIANSFLDLVRCTVASRHLPPTARATIAPRLHKLTEDVFVREIFNPQPSLDSIKALLILALWTPICGTGAEPRDGRLLITSAVSVAMNLHLQDASKRALSLRAAKEELSSEQQSELSGCIQRWRMWVHLSICESILCLGTGRKPVSYFSPVDQHIFDEALFPESLSAVRDVRLGLMARMFDMVETALKLGLESPEGLGHFFEQINESIYSLEGLSRLFAPLPVITPHDTFYSQMLLIKYHACRLLIMHHALREIRTVHERDVPQMSWFDATTGGHRVSIFWGRMALMSAESILTTFLATSDLSLLSTAPDSTFVQIGFASTWIFVSNFSVHQLGGSKLGGASELLQTMTIQRLNQIAHSPEHAAARCGHVLGALMNAWQRRKLEPQEGGGSCAILDIPYASFQPISNPALAGKEESMNSPRPSQQEPRSVGAGADLFMDDAFWAAFLENLESDTAFDANSVTT